MMKLNYYTKDGALVAYLYTTKHDCFMVDTWGESCERIITCFPFSDYIKDCPTSKPAALKAAIGFCEEHTYEANQRKGL